MTERTYDVEITRIKLGTWFWSVNEHVHTTSGIYVTALGSGDAFTHGQASRNVKQVVRHRRRELGDPWETV